MQIDMLELIDLSQNEILKEKLSEFFVWTSVVSSSQNKNNSSMDNNYCKSRLKNEISVINKLLISSSKSNNEGKIFQIIKIIKIQKKKNMILKKLLIKKQGMKNINNIIMIIKIR